MDAYSNTPHKGTNNGAKYCENRVNPTMSQAESTKRLTEQDEARAKTKKKQVADSFHKTQLHSSEKASQHLQKEADSHLKEEMKHQRDTFWLAPVPGLGLFFVPAPAAWSETQLDLCLRA
jgi:hypothetical protein